MSFGLGAGAGVALSPIPWKLADDSAIWTQMWPWTPVPEDGEVSYVHSTCTLCPGGCGITVRKVKERAVKIEGMTGHPINDGGICLLGLSGLQLLYGPTRVKHPLKRNRSENRWERITWSEALSLVAGKLGELRSKGQPHTVAGISGSEFGTLPNLMERFLSAYGSPNFMTKPSMQDAYRMTMGLMQGETSLAGFDLENSDHVLSFGSGLLDGWGSPVRMFRAKGSWGSAGGRLVQVEPRLSKTAAKADRWVPITPGTEAVLALGMAHAIIEKALYREDFVDGHAFGFEDWIDDLGRRHRGFKRYVLDEYDLGSVEKTTGISRSDIVSLSEDFARAKRPLAVCGSGQGSVPGSLQTYRAVQALNAMVGSINRQGGVWSVPAPDHINWPQAEVDDVARGGATRPRLDGARSRQYPLSRSLLNRFFEAVRDGKPYPVQLLFVTGANPLYSMPGSATVGEAFDKIPFVVSFSSYMDETAQKADLVLPNHTYLERWEDVPVTAGNTNPILALSRPVVKPQFVTRHTGDVIIELAKRLGGSVGSAFPWRNYESCLRETLGSKWDLLVKKVVVTGSVGSSSAPEGFATPSKKFEFLPTGAEEASYDSTNGFPRFTPTNIEGEDGEYPLVLIPYDAMNLASGYIGDPPFVMKTVSDAVLRENDVLLEINPATAEKHGLGEGRDAELATPKGKARVKIRLFDGIMPGVVALPRGLGHTAYDKFLAGKGVNTNELVGPVEDPMSGLDAAWGIRAKLSKA